MTEKRNTITHGHTLLSPPESDQPGSPLSQLLYPSVKSSELRHLPGMPASPTHTHSIHLKVAAYQKPEIPINHFK